MTWEGTGTGIFLFSDVFSFFNSLNNVFFFHELVVFEGLLRGNYMYMGGHRVYLVCTRVYTEQHHEFRKLDTAG
jgi:hypothetical protein